MIAQAHDTRPLLQAAWINIKSGLHHCTTVPLYHCTAVVQVPAWVIVFVSKHGAEYLDSSPEASHREADFFQAGNPKESVAVGSIFPPSWCQASIKESSFTFLFNGEWTDLVQQNIETIAKHDRTQQHNK